MEITAGIANKIVDYEIFDHAFREDVFNFEQFKEDFLALSAKVDGEVYSLELDVCPNRETVVIWENWQPKINKRRRFYAINDPNELDRFVTIGLEHIRPYGCFLPVEKTIPIVRDFFENVFAPSDRIQWIESHQLEWPPSDVEIEELHPAYKEYLVRTGKTF